jgi:hypothetical protein
MPSRHSTERGSAGSNATIMSVNQIYPALPRSVLCLLGYPKVDQNVSCH